MLHNIDKFIKVALKLLMLWKDSEKQLHVLLNIIKCMYDLLHGYQGATYQMPVSTPV